MTFVRGGLGGVRKNVRKNVRKSVRQGRGKVRHEKKREQKGEKRERVENKYLVKILYNIYNIYICLEVKVKEENMKKL